MSDNNKVIEQFIDGRGLSEDKIVMLRYLGKVCDVITFNTQPKGRSTVRCEFDCGAYKGSEILSFKVSDLNPITIASKLMSLTSGHHFSYSEAENFLIQHFKKRI